MSQRRSQRRGGVATGGGLPGSTSADGDVLVRLIDVIFWQWTRSSTTWQDFYAGSVAGVFHAIPEIRAKNGTQQQRAVYLRPVLSVAQLLWTSIRARLSRTYFIGTELQDDELREALAKHAVLYGRFYPPVYCGGRGVPSCDHGIRSFCGRSD